MKNIKYFTRIAFKLLLISTLSSCGSHGGSNPPAYNPYSGDFSANVMPVVVGDCGANGYANEPCTEVKICATGTTNCQTIQNILVDTGSYGLRIFSSQVTVGLKQVVDSSGNPIGECAQFGTSNTWGSVQVADVVLCRFKSSIRLLKLSPLDVRRLTPVPRKRVIMVF